MFGFTGYNTRLTQNKLAKPNVIKGMPSLIKTKPFIVLGLAVIVGILLLIKAIKLNIILGTPPYTLIIPKTIKGKPKIVWGLAVIAGILSKIIAIKPAIIAGLPLYTLIIPKTIKGLPKMVLGKPNVINTKTIKTKGKP